MNIILIATECFPFAKATTLGDMVNFLAKGIEKEGHNVKVFIPRYGSIDPAFFYIERIPLEFKVPLDGLTVPSSIFKGVLPDSLVNVFFIESQNHFSNSKEIYLPHSYQKESQSRNSFFCTASLEAISKLRFNADIIHFFNPECVKIAKLLRSRNIEYSFLNKSKLIFTIQNLEELLNSEITSATNEAINLSDFITTSSKALEEELLLNVHNVEITPSLVKKKDVFKGILSGIDEETYNPETDSSIAQTYSKNYFSIGKRKCKEDLLELAGFETDVQIPLFGIITRLQKDNELQILTDILPEIADLNLKLIVFGKGEEKSEEHWLTICKNYKNIKICPWQNYDLTKKIYAGSDFYLCLEEGKSDGTSVLTSMRYGGIPIAFNSSAIKEIITDIDSSEKPNGIVFRSYTKEDFFGSIIRATKYYKNKEKWAKLVKETMSFDTSRLNTSKNYLNIYESSLNEKKSQEISLAK